jgi:type VI secretion system secreted protein Hcp
MAQTVHLWLEIDGNRIEGESRVATLDRRDTIECSSFHYEVTTPRDAGGQLTGARQHAPVKIHKRIDKSTPLLLKALCQFEPVNRAEFRFYRTALTRTGETEQHFFTVLLENGFISSVKQVSEDVIMAGAEAPPMMEEVAFLFQDITWTYEIDGATHKDAWAGRD